MEEYAKIQDGAQFRQIGGYLRVLESKFQIVERRHPVFSAKGISRKARYYIADNFLSAWLGAIERQIKASRVRPMEVCLKTCSERLQTVEGRALEKLVRLLLEELSRKGDPLFQITTQVTGFWNRPEDARRNIEIDLLLVNEDDRSLRVATCKRSPGQLLADSRNFSAHQEAFLATKEGRRYSGYRIVKSAFAPTVPEALKEKLRALGFEAFGFDELLSRLP